MYRFSGGTTHADNVPGAVPAAHQPGLHMDTTLACSTNPRYAKYTGPNLQAYHAA